MNIKKYISLAGLLFPLGLAAQTEAQKVICDFESDKGYTKVGVYDTWENSPFRTGKLTGNVKVCNNPMTEVDSILGFAPNDSKHVLGVQRSRYGSNTFGALVALKEPIALTFEKKYIRVKVYTTEESRFMLIGLGKRKDRPGQSNMTEQLWETSMTKVGAGKWFDAVFPISGNPGAELHNLLIVPDLASPHNRKSDFLFYIDEIDLSNDPTPRFTSTYYAINYDEAQVQDRGDRNLTSISFQAAGQKAQTLDVKQGDSRKLYTKLLNKSFTAKAGQKITPTFSYKGNWMNGYVYLDVKQDGRFNVVADGTNVTDKTDIMSFSNYNGKNSEGKATANGGNVLNSPAFTIPADLKPGIYRLRYKVDWSEVNPGGNTSSGNSIVANGGAIVDTRLIIHEDHVTIKRGSRGTSGGLNGDVLNSKGEKLEQEQIPFGQPYTVKVKPAPGFKFSHFLIRHGQINQDSLVYDTPQYFDVTVPGYKVKNDTYVIPAEYVDGDVEITPYFKSTTGDTGEEGAYAINFDKTLEITRTDRKLNSFTMATSSNERTKVTLATGGKNLVYRSMMDTEVSVRPGDQVTTTTDYTGRAMHGYLYIDFNNDGEFSTDLAANGKPAEGGELVAYSHYEGKNSLGETVNAGSVAVGIPVFTVPTDLPAGNYRARYKIDWSNIDPAGQWAQGGNNQIDANGGYVVDFLLNVHPEKSDLDIRTTNGSIVGANNTGMPQKATFGQALGILPVAAAKGYAAKELIVRHGHDLDGDQYIMGNRQWKEDTLAITTKSLPASMMNGEVRITADFQPSADAAYELKFFDEFDQEDGKVDLKKWSYRNRTDGVTWARFIATTPEGREMTSSVKNGKYVAQCFANPFDAEKDNKGNKLEMISGAIHSEKTFAFTYGKVEGRMTTTPHTGNFPAFWMMPVDGQGGWPACGEIDIWEQIDMENKSYHTIHSEWGNTHGQANNPKKSYTQNNVVADQYHVFGFEWTDKLLTWYVDGKKVFSYAKKEGDQNALNKGQWPFDKDFYLILNQSVGNGSWAKPHDKGFTYETLFDWVRVYQKTSQTTGVEEAVTSTLDFYIQPGKIRLVAPVRQHVRIVDLQGRTMFNSEIQGNVDVTLPQGVYVLNGNKVLVP